MNFPLLLIKSRASTMEREVLTFPLTVEQVRGELRYFVEYFRIRDIATCDILFGFAWGNEYYPGNDWTYETVKLAELEGKVSEVESTGIGSLGRDDLFVKIVGLEFQFCHESDVHICFEQLTDDVENFYSRWKALDYQPAEWISTLQPGSRERLRFK